MDRYLSTGQSPVKLRRIAVYSQIFGKYVQESNAGSLVDGKDAVALPAEAVKGEEEARVSGLKMSTIRAPGENLNTRTDIYFPSQRQARRQCSREFCHRKSINSACIIKMKTVQIENIYAGLRFLSR